MCRPGAGWRRGSTSTPKLTAIGYQAARRSERLSRSNAFPCSVNAELLRLADAEGLRSGWKRPEDAVHERPLACYLVVIFSVTGVWASTSSIQIDDDAFPSVPTTA